MATGHIRKRTTKSGKTSYQVIVESEHDPLTGKRERQYKTVNGTRKQAEALLRKMIGEVEEGNIITTSSLKTGDWLIQWVNTYLPNIEETTRAGYNDRIKNCIIPYLGSVPLKSLKANNIQQWINQLHIQRGLSPKSIKNIYLNLKAALDKAVILRMLSYNPCSGVELPKLQKYKAEIYDKNEIALLLDTAKGTDIYLIVLLTVSIGFRRGELIALCWDDVDFENGIIHVRHNTVLADGKTIHKSPKTSAGVRDISIGDNLVRTLKEAHTQYLLNKISYGSDFVDSNLVICQKNGKPYHPDSITQKWERFVAEKGLKHIRFHDLRHSCATAMIEAGVDPKTVQHRLGHADISITMNIYAHSTKSMDKSAAEKMEDMIFHKASGE